MTAKELVKTVMQEDGKLFTEIDVLTSAKKFIGDHLTGEHITILNWKEINKESYLTFLKN